MASEWPLLTGGRCSEVAVYTGLAVSALSEAFETFGLTIGKYHEQFDSCKEFD